MTIQSIKELDKLMQLCRKRGVRSIKIDNIEFYIETESEAPTKAMTELAPDVFDPGTIPPPTKIDTPDELSEEQLLMWSSAPSQGQ